jgi:HK97 family phage major capsid protein
MTLKQLQDKAKELASKGQAIVDNPDLSSAEKREQLDNIDPDIKSTMKALEDEMYLAEQRKTFTKLGDDEIAAEQPAEAKSPGEQFVNADAYQAQAAKGFQGRRFQTGPVELKDTVTTIASPVVQPQLRPGVVDILFNRLTIADLIPQASTSSSSIKSIVEKTATNAADTVLEEGEKPPSYLEFEDKDEPVRKIATVLKASDEMLADLGWVTGYINGRLVLFVRQEEENQLLNGGGTNPDIEGILERDGLVTAEPGGANGAEAIYRQMSTIRAESFLEPDAVVVHPNDWRDLRLSTDQNDQYYAGGPFTGQYGQGGFVGETIWGLRVVVTPAIDEGTALVGAFSTSAQIFRRSGITVDMTNSNEDDFNFNRVSFRAEERLALVVYRPQGFGVVDFSASA